ncbi:MAG: hypothetical protein M9928_22900 [Anaerolineae bacterium]|nr:hypothetical protein [Anaerolineae bacterium]
MGQTSAEKIISRHIRRTVRAGDIIIVPVDGAMATDTTAPLAIKAFREMGGRRVWDAGHQALVIDRSTSAK